MEKLTLQVFPVLLAAMSVCLVAFQVPLFASRPSPSKGSSFVHSTIRLPVREQLAIVIQSGSSLSHTVLRHCASVVDVAVHWGHRTTTLRIACQVTASGDHCAAANERKFELPRFSGLTFAKLIVTLVSGESGGEKTCSSVGKRPHPPLFGALLFYC